MLKKIVGLDRSPTLKISPEFMVSRVLMELSPQQAGVAIEIFNQ